MKKALKLIDVYADEVDLETWRPMASEDIYTRLVIEIGYSDWEEEELNYFYVSLATPEALRKHRNPPIFVENRTLVISEYSYSIVKEEVLSILRKCSRETFEESCDVLQRYFHWEYEDYVAEDYVEED